MAQVVADFFQLNGLNHVAPQTLAELIPWCADVLVAVVLVSGVFRVLGKLAEIFANFRRW